MDTLIDFNHNNSATKTARPLESVHHCLKDVCHHDFIMFVFNKGR